MSTISTNFDANTGQLRRVRSGDLVKITATGIFATVYTSGGHTRISIPVGEYALVVYTRHEGERLHIRKYIQTDDPLTNWEFWVMRSQVERIRSSSGKRAAWEPLPGKVCRACVDL
jgi:hypothetical protein